MQNCVDRIVILAWDYDLKGVKSVWTRLRRILVLAA